MRKILSVFLIVVILSASLIVGGVNSSAKEIPSRGVCGYDVKYAYEASTATLRIFGEGPIDSYYSRLSPFYQSEVKKVIISEKITAVGNYAFENCTKLETVVFGKDVERIGQSAFSCCSKLQEVQFPGSLTSIENNAFYGSGLKEVEIGNNIENLGNMAFGATPLTDIEIDCKITAINDGMFMGCTFLKNVKLGDNIESVENYAFAECSNLTSLTMPCSARIYSASFRECTKLQSITLTKGNGIMQDYINHIDNEKMHYLYSPQYLSSCNMNLKNIVIEDGVEHLGDFAFKNSLICVPLFKGTVHSFGSCAFNCMGEVKSNYIYNAYVPTVLSNVMGANTMKQIVVEDFVTSVQAFPIDHFSKLQEFVVLGKETDISKVANLIPAQTKIYVYSDSAALETLDNAGRNYYLLDSLDVESLIVGTEQNEETDQSETGAVDDQPDEHMHQYESTVILAPTCTQTGLTEMVCEGCGEIKEVETDALGHDFSTSAITLSPTCEANGVRTYYCSRCEETFNEDILPQAHVYQKSKTVAPTCTAKGYTQYICSTCGDTYKDDFVAAKGHVNGRTAVENKVESNCKFRGSYDYVIYCKVCGQEKYRKKFYLDTGAHNFKQYLSKATLTKNGYIRQACRVCGTSELKEVISKPSTFTFSKTLYNGKVQTPKLVIKDMNGQILTQGTSYKLTYAKGRKNVGRYAVKVTFIGKYSGTKIVYFNIVPKGTTISSCTHAGNGVKVQWKKQTNLTDGYQIQYSRFPNFSAAKTLTIRGNTVTSKTITGLSAKTVYYVRVRTFKTVGNLNICSYWSKADVFLTK